MTDTALPRSSWLGKLSAGLLGTLMGGPVAGLIAAGMGHVLDREVDGLARAWLRPVSARALRRQRHALLAARISLAGALARAGCLSAAAVVEARDGVIRRLELPQALRATAEALFDDGLREAFPLTAVVNDFRRIFHHRVDVHYLLLGSLLEIVEQRGEPPPAQRRLLEDIAGCLGISAARLAAFAAGRGAAADNRVARASMPVDEALAVLEVPPWASATEIKQAYRRLIGRHHPDRLAHLGLPPEQLAEAGARTVRIRKAYESLRRRPGFQT